MFVPSSSNFSSPYNNQTKLENFILNPVSKEHQEHPSSFSHLQDLSIQDDDLFWSNMFTQNQILMINTTPQTQTSPTRVCNGSSRQVKTRDSILEKESKKQLNRRKTTGKKDRHSKICTSQGPRDRRMRLSLQIARKFFDLQDMLGFDKPSKTVEWLFSRSKTAIKELKESIPQVNLNCFNDGGTSEAVDKEDPLEKIITGSSRERKSRKIRTVPRESREKARARARERTREKHMIRDLEKLADPMFEIEEIMKSEVKQMSAIEATPLEDASSSTSSIFIYSEKIGVSRDSRSHEDFHGFVMNWDATSTVLEGTQSFL